MINIYEELKKIKSGLNYNMYRFDKASNFISFEKWVDKKLNDAAQRLVKELSSYERFINYTDMDIILYCRKNIDRVSEQDDNSKRTFYAYIFELQRRNLSL